MSKKFEYDEKDFCLDDGIPLGEKDQEKMAEIEHRRSLVTTKKIEKTTRVLLDVYFDFIETFKIDTDVFKIDEFIVKDIVRHYFRDVERIHYFHKETPCIDCHKIAGYLSYWIAKLKPISVRKSELYLTNPMDLKTINEMFALIVAIGRVNANLESKSIGKRIECESSFIKSFVYNLRYRQTSGDNLSMTFYFLEKSAVREMAAV